MCHSQRGRAWPPWSNERCPREEKQKTHGNTAQGKITGLCGSSGKARLHLLSINYSNCLSFFFSILTCYSALRFPKNELNAGYSRELKKNVIALLPLDDWVIFLSQGRFSVTLCHVCLFDKRLYLPAWLYFTSPGICFTWIKSDNPKRTLITTAKEVIISSAFVCFSIFGINIHEAVDE